MPGDGNGGGVMMLKKMGVGRGWAVTGEERRRERERGKRRWGYSVLDGADDDEEGGEEEEGVLLDQQDDGRRKDKTESPAASAKNWKTYLVAGIGNIATLYVPIADFDVLAEVSKLQ